MQLGSVESAPGSVPQVRETAAYLTRFAKATDTVLLMVGHITKDNSLAGPMTLNHLIDTGIMLSSTDDARYRLMRATKNRFGPVNEVGVFAMTAVGMKEVKNPSAIFLSRSEEPMPGTLVTVLWEGTRPLLVEIQALVDATPLSNPRRLAVGVDQNRLSMLLAVAHRHGTAMGTGDKDVFVNVVGGIRIAETSADLGVLLAVASSLEDATLPQDLVAFGEVGLSGEVRPVQNGQERLLEAAKHGFTKAIVPKANVPKGGIPGLRIVGVSKLGEAFGLIEEFRLPKEGERLRRA
jgi:DNA repair protein RadA/Sms